MDNETLQEKAFHDSMKISDDFVMQVLSRMNEAKNDEEMRVILLIALSTIVASSAKLLDLVPENLKIVMCDQFIKMYSEYKRDYEKR